MSVCPEDTVMAGVIATSDGVRMDGGKQGGQERDVTGIIVGA